MNKTTIMIGDNPVNVDALYYLSNNNYYMIYTDLQTDENDFIILHIVKILQEVVNTSNGPQPTGYLIGTTINNDDEYNLVKQDIAGIIDAKQNNLEGNVHFLDASTLNGIKIRDTKIFRLKRMVYEQVFGSDDTNNTEVYVNSNVTANTNDSSGSFEERYYKEVEKNKELQTRINDLNNKLDSIRNML